MCRKVRKIAEVQDAVSNNDHCRNGSCEQSIKDLLSPTGNGNGNDTIPFMLLCGCENTFAGLLPYFAWGAKKLDNDCSTIIPSPFFKVKKFKDDDDCCAILELLIPTKCSAKPNCPFKFGGFKGTGVCVEVDLSCFTGITCFNGTTLTDASEDDMTHALGMMRELRSTLGGGMPQ